MYYCLQLEHSRKLLRYQHDHRLPGTTSPPVTGVYPLPLCKCAVLSSSRLMMRRKEALLGRDRFKAVSPLVLTGIMEEHKSVMLAVLEMFISTDHVKIVSSVQTHFDV